MGAHPVIEHEHNLVVDLEQLDRVWSRPPGLLGYMSAVNHRIVGLRFIVTALVFFVLAGVMALLMRAQLAQSQLQILSPELYNQLMTLHGTTMMFLFAVPVMEGIGIYLVPLMIGTRDMAFPRLSAFSYWVYLLAGIALFGGALYDAPDAGWFAYVPLSTQEYSPGLGLDFWATALTFLELAALAGAVELIVTIFKQRAPGMTIDRMPVFVWAILIMSVMIVFAMPTLIAATAMLAMDRTVDARFFDVAGGGDPVLWQHLFWFFGHPEVYIIFVPGIGIVAAVTATFAQRPMIGYRWQVLSLVAVGFLAFGLWVHHMFSVGLPKLGMSFFTAASLTIAIPSGIQIFSALATIWYGKPILKTPLLFVLGFVVTFVLGGVTGVMVALVPFNQQVHDTYFIVAHFHYVLIGGAVFPLLAGIYYWFPKVTGRMMSERLGKVNFWTLMVGFHTTFFPMHITGMLGMPRRVYTYLPELGWDTLNLVSTIGAGIVALSVLMLLVNVLRSVRGGAPAGSDPWGAGTLEWATSSPPAQYNFREIPVVASRYPLWDEESLVDPARGPHVTTGSRGEPVLLLLDDSRRECVGTTPLDAFVERRVRLPGPTHTPLVLALAVAIAIIGVVFTVWAFPIGVLLAFGGMLGWFWPRGRHIDAERSS
jgi:cytochrome c oxidase subunit I+III